MSTFMRWESIEFLEIYAGAWALDRIQDLLFGVVLRGARSPVDLRLIPIQPGMIFDGGDFQVNAFPVFHRSSDSFGFEFVEKSRRPFLPEKADELLIPPGPWRRELVFGNPVQLPDGRRIAPEQVLGPERIGTRLVHVGDVGRTDDLEEVSRNADALVIEATYLDEETEMAKEFAHLTACQAADLARRCRVGHLFLTHISRRYRERDVIAEAQAGRLLSTAHPEKS